MASIGLDTLELIETLSRRVDFVREQGLELEARPCEQRVKHFDAVSQEDLRDLVSFVGVLDVPGAPPGGRAVWTRRVPDDVKGSALTKVDHSAVKVVVALE